MRKGENSISINQRIFDKASLFLSGLKRWRYFILLLILVYFFRLFFGLCAEFWLPDEKQIYLLGLKFYTTGEWPFFGPDVVYTNSQIPGALQALLVGIPFYILPIPEAPFLLLNILSLSSLCLLAWYCTRRTPEIPKWLVWAWLLTAPWSLNYSTQVLNSSYVLPGAILFFVGAMESYPLLRKSIVPLKWANFMMGVSLFWIFQLHMSWPILLPFILASFYCQYRDSGKRIWISFGYFFMGALTSASLVIPTFLKYGLKLGFGETISNIQLNLKNLLRLFIVLARFLSFASFELSRFIGENTVARLNFFEKNPWIIPFAFFVGIIGIIQPVVLLLLWFSKKKAQRDWRSIKYFILFTFFIVYFSFAFSVKEPSSHTFYVVFPVVMIYSFYCWSKFFKKKIWRKFAIAFIISGIVFHLGLAIGKGPGRSLYKNRDIPKLAIEKKDYKILGERRPSSLY